MNPRERARWAFATGATLLLLSAIAAGVLIAQVENSNRRVTRAFAIQVSLEDLESTLSAAGRARVLYVSTGEPQYLNETESRLAAAKDVLDSVVQQGSTLPGHQEGYARLAQLAERRMGIIRAALLDA